MSHELATSRNASSGREILAVFLTILTNGAVLALWYFIWVGGVSLSVWLTPRPLPPFHPRLAAHPPSAPVPAETALHGRDIFRNVCSACHGPSGFGVSGLGRDLVRSDFVAESDDAAMIAFIEIGRPADHPLNLAKVAMPPKGGNPALTREDLGAVVSYVRGLQDPRRMPPLPAWAPKPIVVSEDEKAAALAAAGGDAELAEYIASGNRLFHTTCIACHGPGGVGIAGNGKPLARNEFIQSLDDDALLAFVKKGRMPTDPKNTTGIQMPPKGGNPAMTDDDILDVIAYLRTLQPQKAAANSGKLSDSR